MIWRRIQYLRHCFYHKYRKGHHIHSPCVFELVNGVIFAGKGRERRDIDALNRRIKKWEESGKWACPGDGQLQIIDEPYKNIETYRRWKARIKEDEVRVSIDLFHVGILLLRPDLHMAHYKIKF